MEELIVVKIHKIPPVFFINGPWRSEKELSQLLDP